MRPVAAVALALLTTAGALPGCLQAEAAPVDVLTTHYPLHFVASRIAGDNVSVGQLIRGVAPHDYEPRVGDAVRVADAGLYVAQGAGYDWWLHELAESLGDDAPPVVDTTRGLPLIDHADDDHDAHGEHEEHGARDEGAEGDGHGPEDVDPHTWVDPSLLARQARAVEAAMAERWPEHAPAFHARADALVAELEALDARYAEGLAECDTRVAVVNHNAFSYLGRRHNVTFEAVYGLSPDAEPSPQALDRLARLVRAHNITVVFFEETASPGVIQTLAEETGAEARVLSPVETLTEAQRAEGETYVTRMEANLQNLREALRCQ